MSYKHPVLEGHPLHAMLSDLPAALIPTAFLAAVAERRDPSRSTRLASDSALTLASATAAVAGAAGWWDWVTMPKEHSAKKPATLHGLINSFGMLLLPVAWKARSRRAEVLGAVTCALFAGAWVGGDLVFHHGWRVRPAEEKEIVEKDLRSNGDGAIVEKAAAQAEDFEKQNTFRLISR